MSVCRNCGSRMGGVCWDCFVRYPAFSVRNNDPANVSFNVGIPEKRRQWEDADRRYHGFQPGEDEWCRMGKW